MREPESWWSLIDGRVDRLRKSGLTGEQGGVSVDGVVNNVEGKWIGSWTGGVW